jgi:uncharacterized protein (UPF0276 family)
VIRISANLSDPLLNLLRGPDGAIHKAQSLVDAVEVGPWFSPGRIQAYRADLPAMPFYFHGAGLVARVGWLPGAVRSIQAYLSASASPWLSLHLTFWPPGALALMLRWGLRLPPPRSESATRALVRKIQRLARRLSVPILLENQDPLPFPGCEFEVEPERLAGILQATGCSLLLDVAHARVAAEALCMAPHAYLEHLPLDRVQQLHVSGPRRRGGRLVDAHQPLEEEDYDLLGWLLERTHPAVVTLEYIRDEFQLAEQLMRLRLLIRKLKP